MKYFGYVKTEDLDIELIWRKTDEQTIV